MTNAIAQDALKYKGRKYVFGGGSPVTGWDCSGFVSYVLGHDEGMTLPGGIKNFDGSTHGPVVLQYLTWSGAKTVKSPQAGDLCIWPGAGPLGHIGIATSSTHMISALNPALGTLETPIAGAGPQGVVVVYRSVTADPGSGSATLTSFPGSGIISGALPNLNPVPYLLNALGIESFTDLLERASLILFGAIILILGISRFTEAKPPADTSDDSGEDDDEDKKKSIGGRVKDIKPNREKLESGAAEGGAATEAATEIAEVSA